MNLDSSSGMASWSPAIKFNTQESDLCSA
jgi:hypothetical protein